jgi:hypothetical protein
VAAGWPRAHRPIDYIPGLMHGDYQYANVMFRSGAPARAFGPVVLELMGGAAELAESTDYRS